MFGVAVITLRRPALGCTATVEVGQVMALAAVNLLYGLSVYVLLIFRSSMALLAVQFPPMHGVSVRLHPYTKPALPAFLSVAPDAVFGFVGQGCGETGRKDNQP